MSVLSRFLEGLFESGIAEVGVLSEPPQPDSGCNALLQKAYLDDGWHFPGTQPAFHIDAAQTMSCWLYSACLCYADRSISAAAAEVMLKSPQMDTSNPAVHYSADLVLRYLPSLYEISSRLADGDPILVSMREMAVQWPLSSVGMRLPDDCPPNVNIIQSHPGLWRLYLDRVIESVDKRCLEDKNTCLATQHSFGSYIHLGNRLHPHWQKLESTALPDSVDLLLSGRSGINGL